VKKKPNKAERGLHGLDQVVGLLEDLFILQALRAGLSRDGIREVLGIRPARISAINKAFKRTRKKSEAE
jgi:hypothetical protein